MHNIVGLGYAILVLFVIQGCASIKDYYALPAQVSTNTFNAVIEIPAGTNTKYEYNPKQNKFVIDKENGRDRIIDFLSYPANYGFIPSTLSKTEIGGDGDALDVLILSESQAIGTVIEIIPVALLRLIDDGKTDYKIIAIPKEKKKQIIRAKTFTQLKKDYPKLLEIIGLWFLNYNPSDVSTLEGWENEIEAVKQIKFHLKR